MSINAIKICCVIGDPIEHSLSPMIHNAGYKYQGIKDEYTYVAEQVRVEDLPKKLDKMAEIGVVGVSVTLPLKVAVLEHVDSVSDEAESIGAANTLLRINNGWFATNTDYLGILRPLEKRIDLSKAKVAVIGAGGAARAAVYALTEAESEVTIFNRTYSKAEKLAKEFSCYSETIEECSELDYFDVVINCTKLGLNDFDLLPVPIAEFNSKQIVFDCIYNREKTNLMESAERQGAEIIHGVEMFVAQAVEQFKIFTREDIRPSFFEKVLYEHFGWSQK